LEVFVNPHTTISEALKQWKAENEKENILLLLLPFILLPFLLITTTNLSIDGYSSHVFLLLIDITTTALSFSTSAIQSKYTLFQNTLYALGSPLAGVIISSYHQFLMLLRKMPLIREVDDIPTKKII
jgi:hypothetical protein